MSSHFSNKQEKIYNLLNNLYINDKKKIISWLDSVKTYDKSDYKIPGLFNNSKMQIITSSQNGQYNLILQWIANNLNKFPDYDFKNIPESNFISLKFTKDPVSGLNNPKNIKSFINPIDVKKWCSNAQIHPIKDTYMHIMGNDYLDIYIKAFIIMKKTNMNTKDIFDMFPKNHILFGNIDLVYYNFVKNNNTYEYEDTHEKYFVCKILTENLDNLMIDNDDNKITIELELLRNRFSTKKRIHIIDDIDSNYKGMLNYFNDYNNNLIFEFLNRDYINYYKFPESLEKLVEFNDYISSKFFIKFLENNYISKYRKIIEYLYDEQNDPYTNEGMWINKVLKLYETYKAIYNDIRDCLDPSSGIIENYLDKKYLYIEDPLENYFEDFEKKLEELKKPIYSQLIDVSTFTKKRLIEENYLNDADFEVFTAQKELYNNKKKLYEKALQKYESNKQGSSPTPPVKPTITLPSGKVLTIAAKIDPIHIKDNVIKNFNIEYENKKSIIEEYNRIKNIPYIELIKSIPYNSKKKLMENNEMLRMSREEINNNILYSHEASNLSDRCSEEIDILTNEELNSENYPLAKLQLMARLKIYTKNAEKYRTECIYAPSLYNYLIKCINNKEPFINPITKTKYTKKNIEELMKVIKIIDPSLEVPEFIKHRNDTKLKINYKQKIVELNSTYFPTFPSVGGITRLSFYDVYLSRNIGKKEYIIYDICSIPADIEATGDFATGSTDINSNTMLFNIFKLFNSGQLLNNYLPPYQILPINVLADVYQYIKLGIHFNNYKTEDYWLYDYASGNETTKDNFIKLFKSRAEEINNFI